MPASIGSPLLWIVTIAILLVLLTVDFVLTRRPHDVPMREAVGWTVFYLALPVVFGLVMWPLYGGAVSVEFFTGWVVEKSLSVDNLFVFALIFSQTGIPPDLQRRALFWGVAGALVMRALMIGAGVYLLARFHWVVYPFAALLAYSALRMLREQRGERLSEATCALCTSWVGRLFPISPRLEGKRFLVKQAGRWMATPLLVAVIALESTDLLFAVDSIPAVLSVTRDPFVVYTSNIFALMGLRSLYFLLSGALRGLRFLRAGLAAMLLFAAGKMLAADAIEIPPLVSLGVIVLIFAAAIGASLLLPGRKTQGCTHLDAVRNVQPATNGCQECLALGESWVSLRLCRSCGHVGCCDSSKHRHATAHFEAARHPIISSLEPGEDWSWCYLDRTKVSPPRPQ
jgi:tellurite resistance protein TerC